MDRRTFLAAPALGALAPAALCAQPKPKVKLVSSLPRTGAAQALTDQIANAIRMAIGDWAKAVPFEIEYLDWDDATAKAGQWDADKEEANAVRAVDDPDVMAYLGPYNSGAARVSAPILNRSGLVQVTPTATWPGLTKAAPGADADEPAKYRPGKRITFCRVCPHDASQGPLAARFVAEELKAKTVYVLDDGELYGTGVAKGFAGACAALKVKVLAHESVRGPAFDPAPAVKRIGDRVPDAVFFGGTTQSGGPQLVRALAAAKANVPVLLPDGCYEKAFLDVAGAAALDAVRCFVSIGGINPAHLKGAGAEFVRRYKERHRADADAYAVYGYEAAAVVLAALAAAGKKDREAVRAAVTGTKEFDRGLLGKWGFDADGDTTHQRLTVAAVEKGAFKAVRVLGTD